MHSKFTLYLLLFSSFIFLNATCNDVIPTDPGKNKVVKCIDKSKIDPTKGCPRNIDPVCGCDGQTYGNKCMAERAGITDWETGECPCINEAKINPNQPCTREYRPVCGCDKKTIVMSVKPKKPESPNGQQENAMIVLIKAKPKIRTALMNTTPFVAVIIRLITTIV